MDAAIIILIVFYLTGIVYSKFFNSSLYNILSSPFLLPIFILWFVLWILSRGIKQHNSKLKIISYLILLFFLLFFGIYFKNNIDLFMKLTQEENSLNQSFFINAITMIIELILIYFLLKMMSENKRNKNSQELFDILFDDSLSIINFIKKLDLKDEPTKIKKNIKPFLKKFDRENNFKFSLLMYSSRISDDLFSDVRKYIHYRQNTFDLLYSIAINKKNYKTTYTDYDDEDPYDEMIQIMFNIDDKYKFGSNESGVMANSRTDILCDIWITTNGKLDKLKEMV